MPLIVEVETTATLEALEKPCLDITVLRASCAVLSSHSAVSDPELSILMMAPRKIDEPDDCISTVCATHPAVYTVM